ncbi:MAG: hypothetical protein H2069_08515 [Legionella sp.]|nr:hypothetical protein [Legionella sp.]
MKYHLYELEDHMTDHPEDFFSDKFTEPSSQADVKSREVRQLIELRLEEKQLAKDISDFDDEWYSDEDFD